MGDTDSNHFDAESLEELLEQTIEVPAALLLAAGCCGCRGGFTRRRGLGTHCC